MVEERAEERADEWRKYLPPVRASDRSPIGRGGNVMRTPSSPGCVGGCKRRRRVSWRGRLRDSPFVNQDKAK